MDGTRNQVHCCACFDYDEDGTWSGSVAVYGMSGYANVILEDGSRSQFLAFIVRLLENRGTDFVYYLAVPI